MTSYGTSYGISTSYGTHTSRTTSYGTNQATTSLHRDTSYGTHTSASSHNANQATMSPHRDTSYGTSSYGKSTSYGIDTTTEKAATTVIMTDFKTLFYTIFNKSNVALISWFLAIYIVVYCLFGILFQRSIDTTSTFEFKLGRMIDIVFLFLCILIISTTYFSISTDDKISLLQETYSWCVNYIEDPLSFLTTAIFAVVFYAAIYLFRIPMTYDTRPIFIYFAETIIWVFLFLIILYDFFKYVLGISLDDMLTKLDLIDYLPAKAPSTADAAAAPVPIDASGAAPVPADQNEVFNISNNLYTYDDAQAVCSTFGAQVATYDQIEESYNKGGEWCNYGWSDGQMAFFPTQKSTWDKLQQNPKHKNDCGRPGVNGGYIANPYVKFGVNCYGKKPKPTDDDLAMLKQKQTQIVPKTPEEHELENKINYWKQNANTLLKLSGFNTKEWSEY